MCKMYRSILVISLVLLNLGFAQESNLIKELDLSPKQVRAIRQQRQINMHVEDQLRTRLQAQQKLLNTELSKTEPEQKKVKELVQDINKIRAELYEHKVTVRMETQKVLDQKQRKKLQELQESKQLGQNQQNRKMYNEGKSSGSSDGKNKSDHR